MIKTIESRTILKPWLNQTVKVIGQVADFATAKVTGNSTERRPSILLKRLTIVKGKHIIRLNHIWIIPKGDLLHKEIADGDWVQFKAKVYQYHKFHKRLKNTIVRSYGLTDISEFEVLWENPSPSKFLEDVYVATLL